MYTDDGSGGGTLNRDAVHRLVGFSRHSPMLEGICELVSSDAFGPPLVVFVADRREMRQMYDSLMDEAEARICQPLWSYRRFNVWKECRSRSDSIIAPQVRYLLVAGFELEIDSTHFQRESQTAQRDALLVALALELHRRRHADWPQKLAQLVPRLLPAIPPDRYTGGPLKYRRDNGRPVLYSVGPDKTDNGGRLDAPGNIPTSGYPVAMQAGQPADWILWPPLRVDLPLSGHQPPDTEN